MSATGIIRAAESKDIPRILELLVQVNMVHHRARPDLFRGPTTKYNAAELEDMLRDAGKPMFVYSGTGGCVLGYALCAIQQTLHSNLLTDIKTLYIDDLCVDESARGQHIGRALYDHVCAFAREQGCYNVTLNVWSCNPAAIRFYERCGMSRQKIGMEMRL